MLRDLQYLVVPFLLIMAALTINDQANEIKDLKAQLAYYQLIECPTTKPTSK